MKQTSNKKNKFFKPVFATEAMQIPVDLCGEDGENTTRTKPVVSEAGNLSPMGKLAQLACYIVAVCPVNKKSSD